MALGGAAWLVPSSGVKSTIIFFFFPGLSHHLGSSQLLSSSSSQSCPIIWGQVNYYLLLRPRLVPSSGVKSTIIFFFVPVLSHHLGSSQLLSSSSSQACPIIWGQVNYYLLLRPSLVPSSGVKSTIIFFFVPVLSHHLGSSQLLSSFSSQACPIIWGQVNYYLLLRPSLVPSSGVKSTIIFFFVPGLSHHLGSSQLLSSSSSQSCPIIWGQVNYYLLLRPSLVPSSGVKSTIIFFFVPVLSHHLGSSQLLSSFSSQACPIIWGQVNYYLLFRPRLVPSSGVKSTIIFFFIPGLSHHLGSSQLLSSFSSQACPIICGQVNFYLIFRPRLVPSSGVKSTIIFFFVPGLSHHLGSSKLLSSFSSQACPVIWGQVDYFLFRPSLVPSSGVKSTIFFFVPGLSHHLGSSQLFSFSSQACPIIWGQVNYCFLLRPRLVPSSGVKSTIIIFFVPGLSHHLGSSQLLSSFSSQACPIIWGQVNYFLFRPRLVPSSGVKSTIFFFVPGLSHHLGSSQILFSFSSQACPIIWGQVNYFLFRPRLVPSSGVKSTIVFFFVPGLSHHLGSSQLLSSFSSQACPIIWGQVNYYLLFRPRLVPSSGVKSTIIFFFVPSLSHHLGSSQLLSSFSSQACPIIWGQVNYYLLFRPRLVPSSGVKSTIIFFVPGLSHHLGSSQLLFSSSSQVCPIIWGQVNYYLLFRPRLVPSSGVK